MDASDQATAAILMQEYTEDRETKEMPIAYPSMELCDT